MVRLRAAGYSATEIAKKFGVHITSVTFATNVVRRESIEAGDTGRWWSKKKVNL